MFLTCSVLLIYLFGENTKICVNTNKTTPIQLTMQNKLPVLHPYTTLTQSLGSNQNTSYKGPTQITSVKQSKQQNQQSYLRKNDEKRKPLINHTIKRQPLSNRHLTKDRSWKIQPISSFYQAPNFKLIWDSIGILQHKMTHCKTSIEMAWLNKTYFLNRYIMFWRGICEKRNS